MTPKHLCVAAITAMLLTGSASIAAAQTTTTEVTTPATTAAETNREGMDFDLGWLGLLGLAGLFGLMRRRDRHVHTDTTVGRTAVR